MDIRDTMYCGSCMKVMKTEQAFYEHKCRII